MTQVISGFPGVGKTVFCQSRLRVLDSDSSQFSWIRQGVRHPDFPGNYIAHIRDNTGKAECILVSSHGVVRDALRENNIGYTLVYPSIDLRDEYLERYRVRGSSDEFITFMRVNWDLFITAIEAETFPRLVRLEAGQYLSDVMPRPQIVMCSGPCRSDEDDYCGMYLEGEECPACAPLKRAANIHEHPHLLKGGAVSG